MSYSRHSRHFELSRKWLLILGSVLIATFIGLFFHVKAQALEPKNNVNLYLFWGDGCPHCAHAKEVLEPYIKQRQNIGYQKYEIYYNVENQKKMQSVGEALKIDASGVPLLVVGDKPYVGFSDSTGNEIIERLEYCSVNACPDSVAEIVGTEKPIAQDIPSAAKENTKTEPTNSPNQSSTSRPDKYIDLPLLGKINTAHFSLPVLTVIIALLDGFNPCAMWALLFIITLLIGMKDRKKMRLYGTAFIATSAAAYFMFMAAWLNLFMFIGHVTWVRTIIGLLAIAAGGYYLYDWYQKKTGCKVTGNEKRKEVFVKLREIVKERNIWIGLGGVVLLAAAVNVVELACSAGLPVLYTGILSSTGLETWQYYAYMLLYILFFMLDDLVVFFIAMTTLKVVGIESKYSRVTRLVGGVLMCILGLLLIFAPQVLMFG